MTPAPLSKVIRVVATATNYNPERNRAQILELINGVMGMLYRTPAWRQNYCQAEQCTLVTTFTEYCRNPCPAGFLAVVIPPGISNIREIRVNDIMYQITEERVSVGCRGIYPYNSRNGRYPRSIACEPKAERLKPRLLERDIPNCDNRVVSFRSDSDKDCGKSVGVRYINGNGDEVREDLILSTSPVSTSVSVIEFLEISFPERQGWMVVETAEGKPLGRYHPSIYSPVHEWFRLQSGCCGLKASFRGIQEPVPFLFDTDMVPFSDPPLWRAALKAYDHIDSMELDGAQNAGLARIYSFLNAVTTEDLSAKNMNFNTLLLPESGRQMLGTGRLFSRRT